MADQGLELPVGVGRAALYMAFVRHLESQQPDALFRDPFAEVVMAACAGTAQWDALLAALGATAETYGALLDSPQYRYFPIRTRYFDDADWRARLREAGFDPAQPTAWLVEGLMMYLTPTTGERLLGELSTLSAPGSELLIEQLNSRMLATGDGVIHQAVRSQNIAFASACDNLGTWLAQHGWRASVHASSDPSISFGRDVPDIGWLADAYRSRTVEPG